MRLKYPVLPVLILLIIISIIISYIPFVIEFIQNTGGTNYLSFFIVGFLTPLGVLTPFAATFFINTKIDNIITSVLLAGLGAVLCDSIIFYLLKKLFSKKSSSKEMQLLKLKGFFSDNWVGRKIITYAFFALAGWIIAAPLPDSIGEKLISIVSKLNAIEFILLSFLVNTSMITFFVIWGILV